MAETTKKTTLYLPNGHSKEFDPEHADKIMAVPDDRRGGWQREKPVVKTESEEVVKAEADQTNKGDAANSGGSKGGTKGKQGK